MDPKENSKRKRSENWIEEDKTLLKELIRKRVKDIENKNTDSNTNQSKKKAWVEIAERFNSLCTGGQRNITQLKNQWVATKVSAKKQIAERRCEMKKTGGGSAPPEVPASGEDISVWLPNEFVVDSNEFDSDGIVEIVQQVEVETIEDQEASEIMAKEEAIEIDEENIVPTSTSKIKKIPTKKTPVKSATEQHIKQLTEFDIKCRTELHQLQAEAERRRIRNLDREYDLIKAKIKFYEKKNA